MTLKERLSDDLKEAMRAGDGLRRDVVRSLLTAVANGEIARVNVKDPDATRRELADEDVMSIIQKQAKQRRESAAEYRKAEREDLAAREDAELTIIAGYLPDEMSREDIAAEVRRAMEETGASGPAGKAKLMPVLMGRLKGRADGRVINEVVTELLGAT